MDLVGRKGNQACREALEDPIYSMVLGAVLWYLSSPFILIWL
jgi:hypothetical protein